MNTKKIIIFCWTLFFISSVNAQIQDTEVLFYANGSITNPRISIYVMKWEYGKLYIPNDNHWVDNLSDVVENLKKDINFYEKLDWRGNDAELKWYDREMSNTKWHVYAVRFNAWYFYGQLMHPDHTHYIAFKKDLSEYMDWYEPAYNGQERHTYHRVTKSELMRVNTKFRDFLQ